jgi:hypothetical protein
MFQEDYLIRQINQLARALGKLLFVFYGYQKYRINRAISPGCR